MMPTLSHFLTYLENGNSLILLGSLFLFIGLIVLIRLVVVTVEKITRKKKSILRRSSKGRISRLVFHSMSIVLVLSIGFSFLMAGVSLRTYQTFTKEEKIGTIECLDWNAREKKLLVQFTVYKDGVKGKSQSFSLYGDMWEVNAHILKWVPKANLAGLHTGYRLNQLKGIYSSAKDESTQEHKAYGFYAGQDWLWWGLTKYGESVPFVEAVYGNAVSRPAQPGIVFDILVTTSGLAAKKQNLNQE